MKKRHLFWLLLAACIMVITVRIYLRPHSGLTIVYTTDIQGRVEPLEDAYNTAVPGTQTGGIEYYGYFLKRQRLLAKKRKQPFLFLDSGNFFAGASLRSNLSQGRMMVEVFNALELDGLAVGLKDYAFGEDNLKALSKAANFPFLSCNLLRADGQGFDYIRPYIIKNFNSFKAGIIGVTLPFENSGVFSGYFKGMKFLDPADALKKFIPELQKEGASLIIVLSNLGSQADIRLAEEIKGIDIIIGGSDKAGFREAYISHKNKTIVPDSLQKAAVGYTLDLTLDSRKKIKKYRIRDEDIYTNKLRPDPRIKAIGEKYQENPQEVIGLASADMALVKDGQSLIGSWLADILKARTAGEIALVAGLQQGLKQGDVTLSDVFKVSPQVNKLDLAGFNAAVVELSGDQIKEILEAGVSYGLEKGDGLVQVSGMGYTYDLKRRKWDRITGISFNGQTMDLGRTYKAVLNSYLAAGLGGYYTIKNPKNRYDTGLLDTDIMVEEIKKSSPLRFSDIEVRISEAE